MARNVGIDAASGEYVVFTDSDCVVDPDWLTYLVYKFVQGGFVAVGGPNFPPPEESAIAAYVAAWAPTLRATLGPLFSWLMMTRRGPLGSAS